MCIRDSSAAKTKGKLGFFSQGELLQSINDAAFLLNPGEMSPLVNSEFGFHLLYVFDEEFPENINCKKLTLDQKNLYADIVYGQERDLLLQDYLQDLWACARIEVKDPLDSGLPSIESLPNVEMPTTRVELEWAPFVKGLWKKLPVRTKNSLLVD